MLNNFENIKDNFKKDVLEYLEKHLENHKRLEVKYQVMDGYAVYLFEKNKLTISGYARFAGISAESIDYDSFGKRRFGAEFFGKEIFDNITFDLICDIAKRLS